MELTLISLMLPYMPAIVNYAGALMMTAVVFSFALGFAK